MQTAINCTPQESLRRREAFAEKLKTNAELVERAGYLH